MLRVGKVSETLVCAAESTRWHDCIPVHQKRSSKTVWLVIPCALVLLADKVVGLELLKQQIRQFHHSVVLDKKREDAGHKVKTGGKYHMIFQASRERLLRF